jgi:hypothetical protein
MPESTFLFWKDYPKMLSFAENHLLVWQVAWKNVKKIHIFCSGTGVNVSNKQIALDV